MINFVVCDDNINVLDKICNMLESIFIIKHIDAHIVLKASNPEAVLDYMKDNQVNVFILDIDLKSSITGIDLASKIRAANKSAYIIFTTAHLEYVMLAYKVKTFDFLAKPITLERLTETILRLISDMQTVPKKFIKLSKGKNIINQDDINLIKKDGMKLVFKTSDSTYETYSSFNKFENCLGENFVRCHKSYIVNIDKIRNIKSNNTIIFDDNLSCTIGPKYKNKFWEVLKNYGDSSNNLDSIKY